MATDKVTRRAALGGMAVAAAAPSVANPETEKRQPAATLTAAEFGAAGDGIVDDSAALQRAIDTASVHATSGVSGRSLIRLSPGRQYRLGSSINLKRVTLDVTGASFLLSNDAGFLVGHDCGFISGSTLITCDAGWAGTVFKRDPAIASTVHINMLGRLLISRDGSPDTAKGIAVDLTGFHRSRLDIEVRGFKYGIYARPASASDQTYFNRIALRCQQVDTAINFETDEFDILNGNMFEYVSAGRVKRGIRLFAAGGAPGPGSNTFHIAYIEQFTEAGIIVSGRAGHNMFMGGILESGRTNDVPCIAVEDGAYCNTFITSVAPGATARKAFRSVGAKNNTFFLGAYGTYIGWSTDTGDGLTVAPNSNAEVRFGQPVFFASEGGQAVHDSETTLIPMAAGDRVFSLAGEGRVTGIDSTGLPVNPSTGRLLGGFVEITVIGNGKAALVHNGGGRNPLRLRGAQNVIVPAGEMITFLFAPALSAHVREKSRSF